VSVQEVENTNPVLPPLRPDLEMFPGPHEPDGAPTYNLLDPVSGQYHKIGWAESEVMQHLHRPIALEDLYALIARTTTLEISKEEILQFCQDLFFLGLTINANVRDVNHLMAEKEKKKTHPLLWLMHHYLYFRIPLLYPEKFLRRTLPAARLLASPTAIFIYAVLGLIGIYFTLTQPESYFGTLMDFVTPSKMLLYGITVAGIKALHEFAHAYTAAAQGVRVRSRGRAFIIFWPIPYCDVTDGWRLKAKRARARISFAGVAAEAIMACISLFFWGITPPGVMHSIFFMLSSASLLSTLMVNLNPAMRFDGYYIISDLLGIENMQTRAFALTKWKLRKWLLGLDDPEPESGIPPRRMALLMAYSIYTWIYRIFLYIGIAILVYYKFNIKLLGIVLFTTEILWFLLFPIIKEGSFLMSARKRLRLNARVVITTCVLGAALLWACLPLSRTIGLPCVVQARDTQLLFVPTPGEIRNLHSIEGRALRSGDKIAKGTTIASIHSDSRQANMKVLQLEQERIMQEIESLFGKENAKELIPQKQEELNQAAAQLRKLAQEEAKSHLRTHLSGTLVEWNQTIRDGQHVKANTILGRLSTLNDAELIVYIPEEDLNYIAADQPMYFTANDRPGKWPCQLADSTPVPEKQTEHLALTSLHGGPLTVLPREGRMQLVHSYYRTKAEFADGKKFPRLGQTGTIWVKTKPKSLAMDALRQVRRILLQESNF
jgi:putative peptide zinc metalloprotease protein